MNADPLVALAAQLQSDLRHTARELARIWNYPAPAWAVEPNEVNA